MANDARLEAPPLFSNSGVLLDDTRPLKWRHLPLAARLDALVWDTVNLLFDVVELARLGFELVEIVAAIGLDERVVGEVLREGLALDLDKEGCA